MFKEEADAGGGGLAADRKCCIDVFFVGSQF